MLIAGACIYGGIGNEWQYEFELLDDVSVAEESIKASVLYITTPVAQIANYLFHIINIVCYEC